MPPTASPPTSVSTQPSAFNIQPPPPLFTQARAAKAAGRHQEAVALLTQLRTQDPAFAPGQRFLEILPQYPDHAFTYSRVLDFLLSKGWGFYDCFVTTESLIRRFNLCTGVELGVSYGYHAQHLLEAFPHFQLTGVDAYRHVRTGGGYDDVSQEQFDETCAKTRGYLEPTGRWTLLRATTTEAARTFRTPAHFPVDFLYIDADHSYEAALEDLRHWYPHLRPGGILAGHDYGQPLWPGVQRAVDEQLAQWSLKPTVGLGTVWWTQKPA